jgi:hypothetical protein
LALDRTRWPELLLGLERVRVLERLAAKVRSWFGTAQLWAGAEHVVGDESPAPPDQRLRP